MATFGRLQRPVGELLREWRERRRLSQLELSLEAEVSARHLSFVETGRSMPSRGMILHLADHLEVPLRERNRLLVAARYAPAFSESELTSPDMQVVHEALRQILGSHDPYPAVVVDGRWNLVEANESLALFTRDVPPELLTPPVNVLRASLHPNGMSRRILNLGEWRAHLLGRLRRQVEITADDELEQLYHELCAYPYDPPTPEPDIVCPADLIVPLRIRCDGEELAFFGTIATFGTPLDITVAELVIESFFPADARTKAFCLRRAS